MGIDEIADYLDGLGGVLTLRPREGDGSPEIAWGDLFFYYAPDGVIPRTQPFATIVTKDYPDDAESRLDRPDTFRLNLTAGRAQFDRWTAGEPVAPDTEDALFAHPVYGRMGWLCVVNPGQRTIQTVRELLRAAHDLARTHYDQRAERRG